MASENEWQVFRETVTS